MTARDLMQAWHEAETCVAAEMDVRSGLRSGDAVNNAVSDVSQSLSSASQQIGESLNSAYNDIKSALPAW